MLTIPVPDMAIPRHPPYLAFVEANGLDGNAVTRADPLVVDEDARTLTATLFDLDEQGRRVRVSDDAGQTWHALRRLVTVPLLSDPREHGITGDPDPDPAPARDDAPAHA